MKFAKFCELNDLKINLSKTKVLANKLALASEDIDVNNPLYMMYGHVFQVVEEFKYLGLFYNMSASEKHMVNKLLSKSKQSFQ